MVHLLHSLNDRTIADIVRCLTDEMKSLGLEIALVASSVLPGALRPVDVQVIELGGNGRNPVAATDRLRRELQRLQPMTIFAHQEGPARTAVAATLGMRPRPTLVGIVHNHYSSYPHRRRRLRKFVDAVALSRLDALVGVSPGVAQDLRETFRGAAERVHMVPEPLTRWDRLSQLASERIDHPWFREGPPVVVAVGHVHPRKDQATLVRTMAELRDRGVDVRAVIIGSEDTPYAGEVRRLLNRLGLTDRVEMLGAIVNPLPYIASADALVLCSRNEGLGIVLLEAMGVGTPAISTDAPAGPRWVLAEGAAGLLTPVGDFRALADSIMRILADHVLRGRLVDRGRERAAEFRPSEIARRYLDIAESHR